MRPAEGPVARPRVDKRPRPVRCASCLMVIESRHPWDSMTCGCGSVTVSGFPWRPTVSCLGTAGCGWSEVDDEVEPGRADGVGRRAPAASKRRERIGYR